MKCKVPITSQGKTVGLELIREGGRVVAIRRALRKHMLQKPPAWGFSKELIEFMQRKGVDEIRVICDGVIYVCDMARFLRLAVPFDRGFGQQRHLPLHYWEVVKSAPTKFRQLSLVPLGD